MPEKAEWELACHKCGKTPHEVHGWLERINEMGTPGIWECRPYCGAALTSTEALLGAIEGGTTDA